MAKKSRKTNQEIQVKILDVMFDSKESNLMTSTIAKKLKSNWPTTKAYMNLLAKQPILNEIIVEGKVLGYSLNQNILSILMASKFSEMCSLDWSKEVSQND